MKAITRSIEHSRCLDHLRDILLPLKGDDEFRHLLLDRSLGSVGRFSAVCYDNMSHEADRPLRYDGSYDDCALHEAYSVYNPAAEDSPTALLTRLLYKNLLSRDGALLVIDAELRPTESEWLEYIHAPSSSQGDHTYHFLTGKSMSFGSIESLIETSNTRRRIGVCSVSEKIPSDNKWPRDYFTAIAMNTFSVFTNAFDGAGYLLWERDLL